MTVLKLLNLIFPMLFLSCFLPAQTGRQTYNSQEDSLLQLLDKTDNDSIRMTLYNKLRRATIYIDPLNALKYTKLYGEAALRQGNERNYYISKTYEGHCLIPLGNYEQALEAYSVAEAYFTDKKDSTLIASISNSIGAVYEQSGRDSLAEKYFRQSYHIALAISDTLRQALALNNLSNIQYRKEDFEGSKDLLEKIFIFRREIFADDTYQKYVLNYANTLWELNELKKAKSTYLWLLTEKEVDNFTLIKSYSGLGKIASKEDETENAVGFYTSAYDIATANNFELETVEIASILAGLYADSGQFDAAYQMLKIHHEKEDSLKKIEKEKLFEDALVRYETAKKENNIALLEAGNLLKDYQIQQANFWKWIFISGIMALGILALLLYRLQKVKTNANRELKNKNIIISKSLEEKEILLKEIHHRVKNNLQVITSLLNLQANSIDDPSIAQAITDSKNRIHSIALLHQNLYQTTDVSKVDIAVYFDNVLQSILAANKTRDKNIVLQKNIETLYMDLDRSILLGIILNELVTNAYKHGITKGNNNVIGIKFFNNNGKIEFSVKDNGKGILPEELNKKRGRFGLKLIHILAESLEANININNQNGTEIILTFQK